MSEMSFEDMLNESFKTIRTGEVVTGKVIDVIQRGYMLGDKVLRYVKVVVGE